MNTAQQNDLQNNLVFLNHSRFQPTLPHDEWLGDLKKLTEISVLEGQWLERKRMLVREQAAGVPKQPGKFVEWFENLKESGPGQNDPLFAFLKNHADIEQFRWFLLQEVAGEAGFDDLVALTQLKFPTKPKLEMARNYWDEMGRGNEKSMHGPMLAHLAHLLEVDPVRDSEKIIPEALELGNLLSGFAANRRYAYHSVGALGVVELTAPGRAEKVAEGLKRAGVENSGYQYYLLHSKIDIFHSKSWNSEVLFELVQENPETAPAIAEGALLRLQAGANCFKAYRKYLGLEINLHTEGVRTGDIVVEKA